MLLVVPGAVYRGSPRARLLLGLVGVAGGERADELVRTHVVTVITLALHYHFITTESHCRTLSHAVAHCSAALGPSKVALGLGLGSALQVHAQCTVADGTDCTGL